MKTRDLLLIGGLAAIGYFIFTKKAYGYESIARETTPVYAIESMNSANQPQTDYFSSTKEGVSKMNEITSKGGTLKRTSKTLKSLGLNDTIARLGDGSIKRVTATTAKTDSQGKTALDKIIEKNKATKSPAQLKRKSSVTQK